MRSSFRPARRFAVTRSQLSRRFWPTTETTAPEEAKPGGQTPPRLRSALTREPVTWRTERSVCTALTTLTVPALRAQTGYERFGHAVLLFFLVQARPSPGA